MSSKPQFPIRKASQGQLYFYSDLCSWFYFLTIPFLISFIFCFRSQLLINTKDNKMISFFFPWFEQGLLVIFVTSVVWWWPCLVPNMDWYVGMEKRKGFDSYSNFFADPSPLPRPPQKISMCSADNHCSRIATN